MSKLKNLFLLDLKLLMKNKLLYLKLILFPVVLILILGSILNNDSQIKIKAFNVAFYNEDTSISEGMNKVSLGKILVDKVLKSNEIKPLINLKEVKGIAEGAKLVKDGKVAVFIHIPENFTKAYLKDLKTNIVLVSNKNQSIHVGIVDNLLESFTESIKTTEIDKKEALRQLSLYKLPKEKAEKIITNISNIDFKSIKIAKVATITSQKPISAMQYYSIGMLVMFSIVTAFTIIHNMLDEKLNKTFLRIKSTPVRNIEYVVGKLLGIILAMVLQMIVLMGVTYLIFGMRWGNIFYSLLITIIYGFSIGSIVLLTGLLSRDHRTVTSVSTPILFIFSFLGGSMVSKDAFPASFGFIQKIVPNGQALNAFVKIAQGATLKDVLSNLLGLISVSVVFLVISLVIYKNKGGSSNANA